METYEWSRWALQVELPTTQATGRHAIRLVLVALVLYVDRQGFAWPSTQTLADDVDGLHRRDVQNALKILEEAGVVERCGKAGRSNRYLLKPAEPTGYPVNDNAAGGTDEQPGESTDYSTGYPAPNRKESNTFPPRHTATSAHWRNGGSLEYEEGRPSQEEVHLSSKLKRALTSQGVSDELQPDVLAHAQADPTTSTSAEGRLVASSSYVQECHRVVRNRQAARFAAGPKCEDHPEQVAINCSSCWGDIKAQDRPREYLGKHWP